MASLELVQRGVLATMTLSDAIAPPAHALAEAILPTFYAAVLPRAGHYCLFSLGSQQHTWAGSIDSLLDHTEARIEQQGLYFGTASFKEPTKRTQANVLALRSLRLDIDAGDKKFKKHPDGAYPTQKDALRALREFIRESSLAPTYIISSGEGLHVYYALDSDVEPAVWLAYAKALGTACADLGLKADPTVTCDSARILRPIGTLHPNGSRVAIIKDTGKVYSLADLDHALGAVEHVAITAPARVYDMSVNADVAVPTTPKTIHKIIAACAAMGEVASASGDVPEPFWRAAIGIAKHTVEGAEAAHMLSDGYDGYDYGETQAKFDAWNTGPSTCAEFSKHTKACSTCKHNGKIKSPVMLGKMVQSDDSAPAPEVGSAVPVNDVQSDMQAQAFNLNAHVAAWGPNDPVPKEHDFAIGQGRTGIVPLGAVSVLGGPGGSMKTALAMSVGLHIATGTPWAGHRVDAGAVLFLQLEDDADECRRRAGATLVAQIDPVLHDDAAKRLQLVAMPGVDARLTRVVYGASERTDMAARVIAQSQRLADECGLPVRLIVVDHARLAIGGDANDSSHVTELLRALAHAAKVTGAAVLLLCHSPKSSLNPKHSDEYSAVDVLGSGAFVDNARFAGVITPVSEDERKKFGLDPAQAKKHLAFRVIKSNYSEAGGVVYLRKTPVLGWGVAVPDVVHLAKPVATATGPVASAATTRLRAFLAQHPGRFTKSSLRHQAGKDGPLGMGEKAVAQALASLTGSRAVVARAPSPDEVEQFGHGHQVVEVLHVV